MNYKQHTFEIFWSEEDEAWVARYSKYSTVSHLADSPEAALDGLLDLLFDLEP